MMRLPRSLTVVALVVALTMPGAVGLAPPKLTDDLQDDADEPGDADDTCDETGNRQLENGDPVPATLVLVDDEDDFFRIVLTGPATLSVVIDPDPENGPGFFHAELLDGCGGTVMDSADVGLDTTETLSAGTVTAGTYILHTSTTAVMAGPKPGCAPTCFTELLVLAQPAQLQEDDPGTS